MKKKTKESLSNIFEFAQSVYETKRSNLEDSEFGIPDKRKFPLDTKKHVLSAIKFFNYADALDEKELAGKIKSAMRKYNISSDHIGDSNRLSKYI